MAFWDNWTRKKETHTNAPAHWPKLTIEFDELAFNGILIGSSLATVLKAPEGSVAFMQSCAYEDGILEVPLLVTEKGKKTGVFLYERTDKDAAAHLSGVRSVLASVRTRRRSKRW